jgi:ribose transport system permease protein
MDARRALARYPREIGLILMVAIFSIFIRQFASMGNVGNVLTQLAPILIITIAQAFVLLTGGIDLSQGAAIGLYSITIIWLSRLIGLPGALLACALIAAVYGVVLGYLVTVPHGGLNPLIVTLALMYVITGVCMYLTSGTPLVPDDRIRSTLAFAGGSTLLLVPVPFLISMLATGVAFLLLHRTGLGLNIFAVGNNPVAARVHGISVLRARCWAYAASGVLTVLGSFLLSARIYQGNPHLGSGLLFDSIGGAVLGGVALSGGVGGVWAAARGTLLMFLIQNALYLTNLNSYIRDIAVGILIFVGYAIAQRRLQGELA